MDADETAAPANELFKRFLLARVENISGRIQENDRTIFRQLVIRENCRILAIDHIKSMLISKKTHRRDSGWNGVVSKSGGFGEYKDGNPGRFRYSERQNDVKRGKISHGRAEVAYNLRIISR